MSETLVYKTATQSPGNLYNPDERRVLIALISVIIFYFGLATFSQLLIPDVSNNTASAIKPYLAFAWKNGSVLIFLGTPFWLIHLLKLSRGTTVTNYIRGNPVGLAREFIARAGLFIVSLIAFGVFLYAYSTIKVRIPEMIPFTFDNAFMQLDYYLFLGHHPWKLFEWVYDYPILLRALDVIYDVWAPLMVCTFIICFMRRDLDIIARFRFPLAIIIVWFVGGNVFATFLSSAGPVYFADVTGLPDVYADQFARLEAINLVTELRAIQYQQILWDIYKSPGLGFGGISAMPSMHCATSFLFVLLAWKSVYLRYLTIALFVVIFCSSFILGWHYAVDGLLAIPITFFGWWTSGKLLTHFTRRA